MTASDDDLLVIGGGLIGLAVAWRAALRGMTVTLLDPAPGRAASHAAAGMLAAITEAVSVRSPMTDALLRLGLESAAGYPEFVAELEQATGEQVGYRECGTLAVALDTDDLAALTDLRDFHASLALESHWLNTRQCRELEPMLAPGVRGGLMVPGDHQVDNRLLVAALLVAVTRAGVRLRAERAAELLVERDAARGVRLPDGTELRAAHSLLAAGCWTHTLPGLPPDVLPPIRPVKGQIVRLTVPPAHAPFLSRNVRATPRGSHIYIVPREHGELVIGATVEELGYDTTVTAGAVHGLLRDARAAVPGISELTFTEAFASVRPGSPDNAPLIGRTALPGLLVATGHYRNGVLLTPVTATALVEQLVSGTTPAVLAPFDPTRFDAAVA